MSQKSTQKVAEDIEGILKLPYITPSQAATLLQVSPSQIHFLVREGKIPVIHLGERVYRIPTAELLKSTGMA